MSVVFVALAVKALCGFLSAFIVFEHYSLYACQLTYNLNDIPLVIDI